jgi:hypothetical protein
MWIKANCSDYCHLLSKKNGWDTAVWYDFRIEPSWALNMFMNDWTNWVHVQSPTSVNDNTWHHVVASVDRTISDWVKIYIDWVLAQTWNADNIWNLDNSTNLLIWTWGIQTFFYKWLIDDTFILNKALSNLEIQEIYNEWISWKSICWNQ